ncbi:MAG: RagB/SusD family nutrient uptake outer membrane protein [Rhizobacter sp.]|nr:RagB/SusD family nutrient uptake outer membrane protein [Ferruginibacter sp.]
MKKIITILTVFTSLLIISCKNEFLDKAPGVDLTEDNVFLTKVNTERFMATIYRYAVHSNLRYRTQADLPFSGVGATDCIHPSTTISDEGDASEASFVHTNRWNEGTILPTNIVNHEDFRYYIRWIALRQIALVIKRVHEVPDADDAYKGQAIAEVKFLRALNYMEMLKRYGGVPIVDSVFEPEVRIEVPRSSFDDCVKFILKDLNDAIPVLPPVQSASQTGRATSTAARALKSEVLLYAASPQFNIATPVFPMANAADNKLICYGNYDVNRWKLAADAAKDALDYALANGYGLIYDSANRSPKDPDNGTVGPLGNYRISWETTNNKEFIFNYQGGTNSANGITNVGNAPMTFINPSCFGSFWSGMTMPLNFIRKYEDTLGNVVNWNGGGTDLMTKYRSLDPRFKQSVTYTNAYHTARDPIAQIFNGGKDYANCKGGVWIRKYIPRNATSGNFVMNDPLFRVNELYLNYAEALNEFYAAPTVEAYAAVDTIRVRSKMPKFPPLLTKDQFRQKLRNEIAIEMMGDDHRFWDIKRWLIAETDGVMKGAFQGLQITRVGTNPNYTFTWQPYTFETRSFNKNMYLHPFPQTEFLKGNLVQNPGWN